MGARRRPVFWQRRKTANQAFVATSGRTGRFGDGEGLRKKKNASSGFLSHIVAGSDGRTQMTSVLSKKKQCGPGFCCNIRPNGPTSGWCGVGERRRLPSARILSHIAIGSDERLQITSVLSKKKDCGPGFCCKRLDSSQNRPGYLEEQLIRGDPDSERPSKAGGRCPLIFQERSKDFHPADFRESCRRNRPRPC